MAWKVVKCEDFINDHYLTVHKNVVITDTGVKINDFYTVTIPSAAGIVALTQDKRILLKREYRISQECELIETPAGYIENGEEPIETAKRELLEETGYTSEDWTYLFSGVESSSKLTNKMHMFLAKNCKKLTDQKLDATESIKLIELSFSDAVDMVMHGEIRCSSSGHAILMVARMMGI